MKPTPPGWPRISSAAFYDDAPAAIDWLVRAFGFSVRIRVDGEPGKIIHSELVLGDGVVMVASTGKSPHCKSPRSAGGVNTQSMFAYVDDAEAHCARARGAGAKIVTEPTTNDYGPEYWVDRSYECVDLEGHHWWFAHRVKTGA